jgi:integrase
MSIFKPLKKRSLWADPNVPEREVTYSFKIQWRGKQIVRRTGFTGKTQAAAVEAQFRRSLNSEHWGRALDVLESTKKRRTVASIGDIIAAYKEPSVKLVAHNTMRRNVSDLRLVLAYALDLWTKYEGGRRGPVDKGALVPDVARIDALSALTLSRETVLAYQRARLGTREINMMDATAQNASINGTLKHARDLFSKAAIAEKMGELQIPDLTGFRQARLLPELVRMPEPLNPAEFELVIEDSEAARAENEDLWLCNVIFRQTGLRPSYVVALRGNWLMQIAGGWWLDIRTRPDQGFKLKLRTRPQRIPLSDELATLLLGRVEKHGMQTHLILPAGSDRVRKILVNRTHNAWLKARIGGVGEYKQGNYRMRDTVASALCTLYGVAVAQEALGHTSPLTTMKYYATLMPEVGDLLRTELKAWERLSGGGRVMPFVPSITKIA